MLDIWYIINGALLRGISMEPSDEALDPDPIANSQSVNSSNSILSVDNKSAMDLRTLMLMLRCIALTSGQNGARHSSDSTISVRVALGMTGRHCLKSPQGLSVILNDLEIRTCKYHRDATEPSVILSEISERTIDRFKTESVL